MRVGRKTDPKPGHDRLYPTGFPIRCTHEEKGQIFARAARAQRSASRFLVELGMREEGRLFTLPPTPEEIAVLEGLIVQLRRVGTNLAELARLELATVNGESARPEVEVREVMREAHELFRRIQARM